MTTVLNRLSYFGPASVTAIEPGRVLVTLDSRKAWATLALAGAYSPVVSDVLLVVGEQEAFYAIGVIAGRGRTTITAHGDLVLRAPRGRIELQARDGISLRSEFVRLVANTWEATADVVRHRFRDFCTQARDVIRWRGRRVETEVEDVCRTAAGRIEQVADRDVTIDGDKIHLG